MRGHEEASGVKYVPKELLDEWSIKDPIINFEFFKLVCYLTCETQKRNSEIQKF